MDTKHKLGSVHPHTQVSVWLSQVLGDVEMKKIIGRVLKAKRARNVYLRHIMEDFNVQLVVLGRACRVAYVKKKNQAIKEENKKKNKNNILKENPKCFEQKQSEKIEKLKNKFGASYNPAMVGRNTEIKRMNIRRKQMLNARGNAVTPIPWLERYVAF